MRSFGAGPVIGPGQIHGPRVRPSTETGRATLAGRRTFRESPPPPLRSARRRAGFRQRAGFQNRQRAGFRASPATGRDAPAARTAHGPPLWSSRRSSPGRAGPPQNSPSQACRWGNWRAAAWPVRWQVRVTRVTGPQGLTRSAQADPIVSSSTIRRSTVINYIMRLVPVESVG